PKAYAFVEQDPEKGRPVNTGGRTGAFEILEIDLPERNRVRVARIIDQQVDIADLGIDPADGQLQCCAIPHVDRRGEDLLLVRVVVTQFLHVPGAVVRVARHHHDRGDVVVCCQQAANGLEADSLRGAGHQCRLTHLRPRLPEEGTWPAGHPPEW